MISSIRTVHVSKVTPCKVTSMIKIMLLKEFDESSSGMKITFENMRMFYNFSYTIITITRDALKTSHSKKR